MSCSTLLLVMVNISEFCKKPGSDDGGSVDPAIGLSRPEIILIREDSPQPPNRSLGFKGLLLRHLQT